MTASVRAIVTVLIALWLSASLSHAQTVSEWKSVWNIELSAEPQEGMPRLIHVQMENRGTQKLVGHNLLLNIYVEGSLYGWAADQKIRNETLQIPAGHTMKRTLVVTQLEFADIEGRTIKPSVALQHLSSRKWNTLATLTDLETPRPSYESSYLIWSSKLEVNGSRQDIRE